MTDEELRMMVLTALASVAPELDEGALAPDKNFRDQLDIDSMDFLNYVIALHDALGIEIPEDDQRHLTTINDAVAYLRRRLSPPTGS